MNSIGLGSLALQWRVAAGQQRFAHVPGGRFTWISGYKSCRTVLSDPTTFSSRWTLPNRTIPRKNLLFLDPPGHTELRRKLSSSLPEPSLLTESFQRVTESVVDGLVPGVPFDVVHDFASPVAAAASCLLLGLSVSHVECLSALLDPLSSLFDPNASDQALAQASVAGLELMRFFSEELGPYPDAWLYLEVGAAAQRQSPIVVRTPDLLPPFGRRFLREYEELLLVRR